MYDYEVIGDLVMIIMPVSQFFILSIPIIIGDHFILATAKLCGRVIFVCACASFLASAQTGGCHPMGMDGFAYQLLRWSAHAPVGTIQLQSIAVIYS